MKVAAESKSSSSITSKNVLAMLVSRTASVQCAGCLVSWGRVLGFGVPWGRVPSAECRVLGAGCWVLGAGCQGAGCTGPTRFYVGIPTSPPPFFLVMIPRYHFGGGSGTAPPAGCSDALAAVHHEQHYHRIRVEDEQQ